jgi:hypothetical protein
LRTRVCGASCQPLDAVGNPAVAAAQYSTCQGHCVVCCTAGPEPGGQALPWHGGFLEADHLLRAVCVVCCASFDFILLHSGDSKQHARGAAFRFTYAQLEPDPPSSGHHDDDPLGLSAVEPPAPAVPDYRPPFETIPWQLATNLPYDHLTHQVSTCWQQLAVRSVQSLLMCCNRHEGPSTSTAAAWYRC